MRLMIRSILIHPDPRLKKPCEAVGPITPEIAALGRDMLETMYDAPGIGLAAPQVGVMKRVIVMDCIKDGTPEPMVLCNPSVIWSSEDQNTYEEGCLSIPDQYAEVERRIDVERGLGALDKDQRFLAAALTQGSPHQLARRGIGSRSDLYRRTQDLRLTLLSAGLGRIANGVGRG